MAASIAASISSTIRTVAMSEQCRRRGVNGAVDVEAGHPQLDRRVKLNPPLGGELSGDGGGDGGGDGPTVVAEADLEVPGVVRIDAAGGEDVAESFDSVQPLAGTGVAGVDAGREEAIRHRTVTYPTLATGRSAAVGGRGVGRSVQGLGRCYVDVNVHDCVERPPRPLRNVGV